MADHVCKDCRAEPPKTVRPAVFPGPRCASHNRAFKQASKGRSRRSYVEKTYGVPAEMYDRLGEWQRWRCYTCRVADGSRKALAVHHDHETGEALALMCGPCNQTEGRYKGDPAVFERFMHIATRQPSAGKNLAPARLAWARVQDDTGAWQYANPLPSEQLRLEAGAA